MNNEKRLSFIHWSPSVRHCPWIYGICVRPMTSSEAGSMCEGEVGSLRTHVVGAVVEPSCPGLESHL